MPLPTTHDLHVCGSINGHEFDLVGSGKGNPNEGTEEITVKSTKGAIPCSPYVLVPHLGYGFYQYLPFPGGMSPFQAAAQDGGFEVHRTFRFEDGAMLSANYRYSYEGAHMKGEFYVVASGFPANGPVLTNSLTGQDPTVARTVARDDYRVFELFSLGFRTKSGGTYEAVVNTNITFGKPMSADIKGKLPMFVYRKIESTASDTEITSKERQKAFSEQ